MVDMSKSPKLLYVKGMNLSESEGDDDDQWDDKKLNDAYDKAVRIANVEVAKRVAMSTNTQGSTNDPTFSPKKEKLATKPAKKKATILSANTNGIADDKPKEMRWKPSMPCRLVYAEDGLEYEAVIVRIVDDNDCVVKYLGYDNQELVSIDSLKQSLGKDARAQQIKDARRDQTEDSYGSLSPNVDGAEAVECSDRVPSPDSIGRSSHKKKKPSKKKKNQARGININGFELPEMPPIPNLSMLRNQLGSMEMPMPPPPMALSMDRSDTEDQAISSMLLSWYMSGYYTGLYQGLKRAKDGRRN
ncbi:unnamed protein product [Spodoptera littoralis]|uniref:Tudor domain-containing protein n=1 Tax=Spodoptera littoralis TaxID=7109 RepID=A0A9P0I0J7_SPOLI|nr:unnamed protein product [Spodoptera littoralis]CAH1637453.1 unnamed protein product [Spodoptera littoralis]